MSASESVVGLAQGKVMLFGEYSVLEGGSAILSPSPQVAEARYTPLQSLDAGWSSRLEMSQVDGYFPVYLVDGYGVGQSVILRAAASSTEWHRVGDPLHFAELALITMTPPSGLYEINTQQFGKELNGEWRKMGIGSSGATTAALLDLFHKQLCQEKVALHELATPVQRLRVAIDIHTRAQGGIGSGADLACSVYGQLIRFKRATEHQANPLVYPILQTLPQTYCIWRGGSASTTSLVKQVQAQSLRDPRGYQLCIDQLISAENCAFQLFDQPQISLKDWSQAISQGAEAISSLSRWAKAPLWTELHSKWSEIVKPFGGVIKPTGAGGDDLSILSAVDEERLISSLEALKDFSKQEDEILYSFPL